jgi:hypothetical protein
MRKKLEILKLLKGAKLEDPKDALVVCVGKVNTKNRTAPDNAIKHQVKVLGRQFSVTDFVHK